MLISVVIPVYNVSENLFERALKSINAQDDEQVEIIVIDDGSEQKNSSSYQQICKKFYRCNYYRIDNSGVSAARNYGVQKAQGEYILFVDSDDYITDQCIEQAEHAIDLYHPDAVFGYMYRDLLDDGTINYKSSESNSEIMVLSNESDRVAFLSHILRCQDDRFDCEFGYIGQGPVCRLFRAELFEGNEFDVDAKWSEDTLWNICLLHKCRSVAICKSLWYIYAVREGSAIQSYRKNSYDEFLYITEKVSSVGHSLWNSRIDKALSYQIWHEIFLLSKTLIFHSDNDSSFSVRYTLLKNAIKSNAYQKAVRTVDFIYEKRRSKRIIKKILNVTMKMHCYILTYILLKVWSKRS